MNLFSKILERFFPTPHPMPAGMYHAMNNSDSGLPYRLHLRLEPDGSGLLILNASTLLHLNQTAAECAYHLIMQTPAAEAAESISRRYNVDLSQAVEDLKDFKERLNTLINTPDLDPDTFLGMEREQPYLNLTTPYRLDCALSYQLSEPDDARTTPGDRVKRELSTEEWQTILKKGWNAGIPHIIFTGGEPTLRPDLPDLIRAAEENGQVTGLLTDGQRLAERDFLHMVLQAGLDHVMILVDPDNEATWEALRKTLSEDIFVTAHLTITRHNADQVETVIERLAGMGVSALSLSALEDSLKDTLNDAYQAAAAHHIKMTWDLPVPYSRMNPVSLELQESGEYSEGAGKAWLYVEPDGDVLPGQGINRPLGNLLTQTWEEIWPPR